MQVVGTADAHIVNRGVAGTAELVQMAVETLGFGEEGGIGEIAVHDSDPIVRVEGTNEVVTGFFDGFHVARSDVSGSTDEGEVFHFPNCYWVNFVCRLAG